MVVIFPGISDTVSRWPGFWLFPKGWVSVSEILYLDRLISDTEIQGGILKFRAGLRSVRPPTHAPDYFITCLEAS
jgi:hypothetical protein